MHMLKVKIETIQLFENEELAYEHGESVKRNQTNVWKWESNP